ncbi:MAG: AI-2E family transporter [Gammaproteobacteria bacterium]|nr:AI-2E family transporter [Gammaproteobacteria bacterium]
MNSSKSLWTTALVVGIGVLVYLLAPVLTPFAAAFVIAYVSNPLVERLVRWKLSRTMAVSLIFVVLTLLLLVVTLILIPAMQKQLLAFARALPRYLDWFQAVILPWLQQNFGLATDGFNVAEIKAALISHWRDIGGLLGKMASRLSRSGMAVVELIGNLVLIPLIAFYLMRDWHKLMAAIRSRIPESRAGQWLLFIREADAVLAAFMRGQLSVMAALTVIYAVGLSIVGLGMALPVAMLAGAVSFVPYLGFIIGMLAAGVAALMEFQSLAMLLAVLAVFMVGQVLESFVLTPKLVGDQVGLHPVAVIFAIMAGGQLFGFVGVLLALPVAAVLVVFINHFEVRAS